MNFTYVFPDNVQPSRSILDSLSTVVQMFVLEEDATGLHVSSSEEEVEGEPMVNCIDRTALIVDTCGAQIKVWSIH